MKKLVYGFVAGLTFLASTSLAKNLEIFVNRNDNHNIVQVGNKEALGNRYKEGYIGDTFLNYRREKGEWILDYITYKKGKGYTRKFLSIVDDYKTEIQTYIEGLYSLYYDPDQNEEDLVAVFEDSVEGKVKEMWIELAKEHIEKIHKDLTK